MGEPVVTMDAIQLADMIDALITLAVEREEEEAAETPDEEAAEGEDASDLDALNLGMLTPDDFVY